MPLRALQLPDHRGLGQQGLQTPGLRRLIRQGDMTQQVMPPDQEEIGRRLKLIGSQTESALEMLQRRPPAAAHQQLTIDEFQQGTLTPGAGGGGKLPVLERNGNIQPVMAKQLLDLQRKDRQAGTQA